ncbi:TetR/AcrR family transcriptional regulator [Naasia sp. SYSU D00057]|uniref:TetR/AcrR family transcriptional regulator n=1 Tax=Naasia sp. SYSU D00057 TaxID=2817380 RepID=UPI001B30A8D7|nr:TetR family transcriptional regulator C-terminal domain-containing protein [Naasia sp. SYSU D00057]
MASNRTRALDAAVELVGTVGIRALTHARVDEHAGLPRGSTSNSFRTRRALVHGVADRIAELELQLPEFATTVGPPASADEFVDGLCALLDHLTVTDRTRTVARLALFLEASHDPDLRATLIQTGARMESDVVVTMATLGARDPRTAAAALIACCEGFILHRVSLAAPMDPRPMLQAIVDAAIGG